jgi:hypothetical protein
MSVIVKQLEEIIPMLGATSEAGQAAAEAMLKLAKHVPQGAVPGGVEKNAMEQAAMKARQQAPQLAAMRAAAPAGAAPQGGAPPMSAAA